MEVTDAHFEKIDVLLEICAKLGGTAHAPISDNETVLCERLTEVEATLKEILLGCANRDVRARLTAYSQRIAAMRKQLLLHRAPASAPTVSNSLDVNNSANRSLDALRMAS